MLRAEQDVRFLDEIMKRNFEISIPFGLMDTTEISLHIMGQFEESDAVSPQSVDPNAPMELMFESGRQTSRLTQEGKYLTPPIFRPKAALFYILWELRDLMLVRPFGTKKDNFLT